MKIELNDKGSRDYYDEVLYVASYAARFIKNHNKKVYRLTKFFKFFILFIISYLIIVSIFYLMIKSTILIFLIGFMSLLLMLIIISLFNTNKRIKYFLEDNSHNNKTIEFDENLIQYKDKLKNLSIEWSNINCIQINKYSIIFLPENIMLPLITVDIKYLNEVLEVLKKYDKETLIIKKKDN